MNSSGFWMQLYSPLGDTLSLSCEASVGASGSNNPPPPLELISQYRPPPPAPGN